MKKFKNIILSFAIICLSLFSFTTPMKAATITYYPYFVATDGSIYEGGTVVAGKNTTITFTENINRLNVDISNLDVNLNHKYKVNFRFETDPSVVVKSCSMSLGGSSYEIGNVTTSNRFHSLQFDIPYTSSSSSSAYIRMNLEEFDTSNSISNKIYFYFYEIILTDEGTIDDTINSGIASVNSGISTIQSTLGTVNSNIASVQASLNTLNADMKTSSDNIVGAVGTVTAGIAEMYDGLNTGIGAVSAGITANLDKLTSMDVTLTKMEDYMFTCADKLSSIDLTLLLFWNDFLDTMASQLQGLLNIYNIIDLEMDNVISAIGSHDYNTQVAINNCGNAILSGMNTMNTDIQEQMIAQTTNVTNAISNQTTQIKNGIVEQTNSLNTSIKTMENSIVKKLDDTLVVKDKSDISSNDDKTTELDGAIADYDSVEKNLVTDFNESLDSIDTDSASSIYNQNDFIKTAQFISTNMQNVYESNDFVGGMIDVGLLLGLIFTVIGIGVR